MKSTPMFRNAIVQAVLANATLRDDRAPNFVADARSVADTIRVTIAVVTVSDVLKEARAMAQAGQFPSQITYHRGTFHVPRSVFGTRTIEQLKDVRMGDMSKTEQEMVVRAACERMKAHFEKPEVQFAINQIMQTTAR